MTRPDPQQRADAERAKLRELAAVGEAEGVVSKARMAELVAAQRAAARRHSAAKGLLTKALKDGGAERIAAAHERVQATYAEWARISDAGIDEMLGLNRAGLDRLGGYLDQMGRTWKADAQARDAAPGGSPDPSSSNFPRPE